MSDFVGAGLSQNILSEGDLRLNRMDLRPWREIADIWAIASASFESEWWPARDGLMGSDGLDVAILTAECWGDYDQAGGAASRFGIVGVTRDVYGSALPSCTVKLFKTSDDSKIDQTTSDATTGAFLLNTPYYPDTHYIVSYKTGSPDVEGTTANTLVGA